MTKQTYEIIETPLSGLKVLLRNPIEDARGHFCRMFCAEEFARIGLRKPIAQINHTRTKKPATVRGLHFQHPPYAETKLVSCLRGEVYDVSVDIRRNSPTFLQWHAEILSAVNFRSMLIPEGFAHGFQTLSEECELMYLHTEMYHPEAEGALNVADPRLSIYWPLTITEMSDRDRRHPFISRQFEGMQL